MLLDFWASWCGPCRAEFPTLRRVHARYKEHGLTIIGVTLDSELSRAVAAAKQAKLTYSHVFDGLGWKNAVAQLYRVHGIPQTYLLDSQLNIVAKNFRGPELERRLRELLGPGDVEAAQAVDRAMPQAGGTKEIEPNPWLDRVRRDVRVRLFRARLIPTKGMSTWRPSEHFIKGSFDATTTGYRRFRQVKQSRLSRPVAANSKVNGSGTAAPTLRCWL